MNRYQCPEYAVLENYATGVLEEDAVNELEQHLDGCQKCAATMSALESSTDDLLMMLKGRIAVETAPLAESEYRRAVDSICRRNFSRSNLFEHSTKHGAQPDRIHHDPLQQGQQLGHYELLDVIGRGGMGVVYRAKQIGADRTVALKVLRDRNPGSDELERFQLEVRAAAQLDHPGIVPVYEVGVLRGLPFFSMKLVEGQSLSAHLAGSPIHQTEAAKIVCRVAEAVQFAHDRKIIHRDIKPGNILLDRIGLPYVTDFGLARIIDNAADLTSEGRAIGTPSFMPPEQVLGNRNQITERTDVYGLGALLYACLTGRPPFQGASSMTTMMQVLQTEVVPPRQLNGEVDHDLETICLKCLNKSPDARYLSAQDLADDMTRYLRHEPILARRATPMERLTKWIRRRPAMAGLICAAIIASICALIAGTMGFYYVGLRTSLRQTEAAKEVSETQRRVATAALRDAEVANARAAKSEYFRNIALAQSAWDAGNMQSMSEYLNATRPEERGWEYRLLSNMLNQHTFEQPAEGEGCNQLVLAPDDSIAAAVFLGRERRIRFFDPRTGAVKRVWNRGKGLHPRISFREDFRRMFSVRSENDGRRLLEVWDVDSEQRLEPFSIPANMPHHVVDGKARFAVLFYQSPWQRYPGITVVDLGDGSKRVLDNSQIVVRSAAFTDDGSILVIGGMHVDSRQGVLRTYQSSDWSMIAEAILSKDVIPADLCLLKAPESQAPQSMPDVYVSCEDYRLRRYNGLSLKLVGESASQEIRMNKVTASSKLRRIAAAVEDGRVVEFDARTLQVVREHLGHHLGASSVAYTSDSKYLWSASYDGRILRWDPDIGKPPQLLTPPTRAVRFIAFSQNSRLFATFHIGGDPNSLLIGIWNMNTGELVNSIPEDISGLNGHHEMAAWGAFFDDDRKLVSAGWDATLRIWNVADGALIHTIRGMHTGGIQCAGISPDEKHVFSTGEDGTVGVWDLEQLNFSSTLPGKRRTMLNLSIDRSGKHLIAGGLATEGFNSVYWNLDHPDAPNLFLGDKDDVHAMSFSPDGAYFVSGGTRGRVRAMSTVSRELLWDRSQHNGVVECVAFSPDGSRIATSGADRRIILSDPLTGEPILQLRGHTERVRAAAFSPDGKVLVTGGDDGKVFLWRTEP